MSVFLGRALLGWLVLSLLPQHALLASAPFTGDAPAKSRLRWRYVRTPGLEILSTCSDQKTLAFVEGFARASSIVPLPREFVQGVTPPVQLILADHYLDDALAPAGAPQELRVMRLGSGGIVYSWASESGRIVARIGLRDWNNRTSPVELSTLPLRLIPDLILRCEPNAPGWLLDGCREIFGYQGLERSTDERDVFWGPFPQTFSILQAAAKDPEKLLPLAELFAEAPVIRSTSELERRKAQAALFVHWGFFRRGHTPDAFTRFWLRACREPISEALFRECFGLDFEAGRAALARHIRDATYRDLTWKLPAGNPDFALPLRDATPAEAGRMTADWLRIKAGTLAHHPTLRRAFELKCREVLDASQADGQDDPHWSAIAGLCFAAMGDPSVARTHLERAFMLATDDPRALRELGRLRLDEASVGRAGENSPLSLTQTEAILKPLYQARRYPPASPSTNRLLIATWEASGVVPSPEQIRDLRAGVIPLLRHTSLALALARLAVRAEAPAEASAIAAAALPFADNSKLVPELEKIAQLGGR